MTRYHVAAIIPAMISVVCVVIAWNLLHHTPQNEEEDIPDSNMTAPQIVRNLKKHLQKPPPPPPPQPIHTPKVVVPSDTLTTPNPGYRKLIPTTTCELGRRRQVWKLNFNSECRDRVSWPSSSEWRGNVSSVMRNVSSVRLRSIGLHAAEYNVDVWNNRIDIMFGGTVYQVTIPVGEYASGTDLASATTTAITSTSGALAGFSVSYSTLLDSLTITESTPTEFTLLWLSGPNVNTSAYRVLGFDRSDLTSTLNGPNHEIVGGRVDLDGVLAIDVFADELTKSLDGPVSRVMLRKQYANAPVFRDLPVNDFHTFWPIARLTFLTFRFMVQYGHVNTDGTVLCEYRPYVFHGKANTVRVDLGVTSYINPMEDDVQLDPGI